MSEAVGVRKKSATMIHLWQVRLTVSPSLFRTCLWDFISSCSELPVHLRVGVRRVVPTRHLLTY